MNKKLLKYSIVHSFGVLIYIFLVALLMNYGEQIFGKMNNVWGPIAFLLLFVLSALIVGILVLGKPIILYLDEKKKEAVQLLLYTVLWIFVITLIVFIILVII
ncbi:MAG: hypothetical protein ABH837_01320 [bacterium]